MHSKLMEIVRYWMRYKQGGKRAVLSFGLGEDVAVNLLVSFPTLCQWGGVFNFGENSFVACSINTRFPPIYESTKQG